MKGEVAADLAYHFQAAERLDKAYPWEMVAGDRAFEQHALSAAAEHFTRSIDFAERMGLPIPKSLLEKHGTTSMYSGGYDQAVASLQRLLEQEPIAIERAELYRKLAEIEYRRGDQTRSAALFKEVLLSLDFKIPKTRLSLFWATMFQTLLFFWYMIMGRLWQKKEAKETRWLSIIVRSCTMLAEICYFSDYDYGVFYQLCGINRAERLGLGKEFCESMAQQGVAFSGYGLYRFGLNYLSRARRFADTKGTLSDQAWVLTMTSMAHAYCADVQAAADAGQQAILLAKRSGDATRLQEALLIAGETSLVVGNLNEVESRANQVLQIAKEQDVRGLAHYLLGSAMIYRGNFLQAKSVLEQGLEESVQSGAKMNKLAAASRFGAGFGLLGRVGPSRRARPQCFFGV